MTQEQKDRFIASYYENASLFNAHNGIRLVDVDDHYGVVEVTLTPNSLNPLQTVHGGLIFSLLDVATGVAARSCGRMTVTQDANIYFLRPGKNHGEEPPTLLPHDREGQSRQRRKADRPLRSRDFHR